MSAELTPHFFEDLSVGMSATTTRRVVESDVLRFAEVSGDNNPVHLSEEYARATRFGGRIAHGLFTASLISALIGTKLPGPGAIYLSQTLNFRAPVHLGDVIEAEVRIAALDGVRHRATVACRCSVGGTIVLEGEASVLVPARMRADVA